MKKTVLILVSAAVFLGTASASFAMPVSEFLTTFDRIPKNATALLRSDTRRLMGEASSAMRTVRREQEEARRAGRTPAHCAPERIRVSSDDILNALRAVPVERRSISVTQALREWLARDYPCPG